MHIRDECRYIMANAEGLDYAAFVDDETLKRSFTRSLEIIGEASRNVPEDFRRDHPDIQWKAMAGMRDILIHSYFGVDYQVVWDVICSHIPGLLAQVDGLLEDT